MGGRQEGPSVKEIELSYDCFRFSHKSKNLLVLLLDTNDLFARKTIFLLQVCSSCSLIKENLFFSQDPKSSLVHKYYLLNAFA